MLVLSRQINERIILPTVCTTIAVIAIRPGSVRLGIDAPAAIAVLREELLHQHPPPANADAEADPSRVKHVLCTRLARMSSDLDLLRQQISAPPACGVDVLLQKLQDEVRVLDRHVQALLAKADEERLAPALAVFDASS